MTGIDPVTHHNMSPYMAFDGNPVFWADPSGADGITLYGAEAQALFNAFQTAAASVGGVGSIDVFTGVNINTTNTFTGDGGGGGGGLFIKSGSQMFQYINGGLLQGGVPYNGEVTGFLKSSVEALTKIQSGTIGSELVNAIAHNTTDAIVISKGSNGNGFGGSNVIWDPKRNYSGLDENGDTQRPDYIGLAHEFAHAFDFKFDGTRGYNNTGNWFEDIRNNEIFAGNVENLIRKEPNLPQRKYYKLDITNRRGSGLYDMSLFLTIKTIRHAGLY